ncbi:dTDP-glucose 4,6-dehydratase [Virgibacillus siamensis]|uniref:dTDP-glucose 4,6-dehydratase n=1 Tax=Virgibacillus siamensis TaxID=480071 RepID=A0ABN1FGQ3_9BACI
MNSTLLVTGGAGFIGSNFITYYLGSHPDDCIINLDKLTYAGNAENLGEVEHLKNYHFIRGDITDEQLVKEVFANFDITGVIHFAAESHVDRSIEHASSFIETNVLGTNVLLQAARDAWREKGALTDRRFHHISTDEIYGSLGAEGKFNEKTPYNPRNPYSASKASSNLLVNSYGSTYGMNVVISSSSNNYGKHQNEEKLVPTIISNALRGRSIPIYGDGQNIRDWLYVDDHCRALDVIFHHGKQMETYNIGGRNEKTNMEIAINICDILDHLKPEAYSYKELITFTMDRLGHDKRYAVDDSKLRNKLGWKPETDLKTGMQNTVEWYVKKWEQPTL